MAMELAEVIMVDGSKVPDVRHLRPQIQDSRLNP